MNLALLLSPQGLHNPDHFVFTTTSADGQFVMPLVLGDVYDFDYRVDNGMWINHTTDSLTITDLSAIGERIIEINPKSGGFPKFIFNNLGDKSKITEVLQFGTNAWQSVIGMFYGCNNLKHIRGICNLTVANSLQDFIRSCTNLISIDVSNWDVSNIVSLYNFAVANTSLLALDVSNWNTSNVNDLRGFAISCNKLTVLDVSNWDVSKVTTAISFAQNCTLLQSLDVSNWVTNLFTNVSAFALNCPSLTGLNPSNWNIANITTATNFISLNNMTTGVLDQTYINFALQTVKPNVTWRFGTVQYTIATSQASRDILTGAPNSWTITDGGGI